MSHRKNKGAEEQNSMPDTIPRVIHYCWFGRNPKPKKIKKCMASWKKYCPDFRIVEWNEDNFNIASSPLYVRQAFEHKAWAFVSDVVRLMIIYEQGGIYLDTDVELIRPLDDLLENEAFFGFEDEEYIATGIGFGARKGNNVVKRMLEDYQDAVFITEEGSQDRKTCPVRNTESIRELFPATIDPTKITVIEGATLYPKEWFCPWDSAMKHFTKTDNTHSIHWYSATWLTENERIVHEYRIKRSRYQLIFGKKRGDYLIAFEYLMLHPKKYKMIQNYQ